ncbi:hypothetical protein BDV18DRAFT_166704 [Aspergillus unguis]
MTGCLSARLLCLHRRSSLCRPIAALPSPAASRPGIRSQWRSKHHTPGDQRPVFTSEFLRSLDRLYPPTRTIPESYGKWVSPWLETLKVLRRRGPGRPPEKGPSGITQESFTRTIDLARFINIARTELGRDLLAHVGFVHNEWTTVYDTLSRFLDSVEALKNASATQFGGKEGLPLRSQGSLDELTDVDLKTASSVRNSPFDALTTLDVLTYRPFARDYHLLLMAEVWKTLGTLIIWAEESDLVKSKLAMSVVYRILARLHHSGLVPERIYKYTTPDTYQTTLRPPGMHLLSSHIMDVLSDTAWLEHEAKAAAQAIASGKDVPFLPARINIKELGHNIWLEFILWCCVEHGHIKEGIWLANQVASENRTGWESPSWKPLLRNEGLLRNTRLDHSISTWPSLDSADAGLKPRKRTDPPLPFYGLGQRTISVEVVQALLDNLPNLLDMGMGKSGVSASEILLQAKKLSSAIAFPIASNSELLPTTKTTNWFTTRVLETGGLTPEADPQLFDNLIKLTSHIVPPWSNVIYPVEGDSLAGLDQSQIYDGTSAFTGLMEYNLKYHSSRSFCGSALDLFATMQAVMDEGKMRRVDEFFSTWTRDINANPPSTFGDSFVSPELPSISTQQLSTPTIAHLIDMVTTSRAFAFGEWLLFSDDIDGPTVPTSAYSDQALAPSLLRFAAATKNESLGESVIQSFGQSEFLSTNTIRALLNYHIALHHWEQVIPLLGHIRDYRSKSWAHSNIAAIAAEIIRLEHTLSRERARSADTTDIDIIEANLAEAMKLLYRIVFGEFDELAFRQKRNRRFQQQTMKGYIRLFRGLNSPSLLQLSDSVFEAVYVPKVVPYIPPPAFHLILAAVAETQGARAARLVYKRFCVSYDTPEFARLISGGITRFYQRDERDYRKGDPHYDAGYSLHVQKKMAAIREYQAAAAAYLAETETETATEQTANIDGDAEVEADFTSEQPDRLPKDTPLARSIPDTETSRGGTSLAEAEKSINFCITRFRGFLMSDTEIAREVGEEIYTKWRLQEREKRESKRVRDDDLQRLKQCIWESRRTIREVRESTDAIRLALEDLMLEREKRRVIS